MHHYDIYRDQLATMHPSFGYALWDPAPEGEYGQDPVPEGEHGQDPAPEGEYCRDPAPEGKYGPVKVGDVGFVREGRFFRLFNALLPADDPSHKETPLPEYHEPLIPNLRKHIYSRTPLRPDHYCSAGVNIAPAEPDYPQVDTG